MAAPPGRADVSGFRRPDGVAAHLEADHAFLARVPEGPILVLDAVGGIIWEEALAGDRADLADRVAERTGAESAEIRDLVEAFVRDLVIRGLLAERG